MATNRLDQTKQAEEAPKAVEHAAEAAPAKGASSWIPLIANIILMPAIAYGLTTFVLIPKIQGGKQAVAAATKDAGGEGKGAAGEGKASLKGRITVPLGGKVLVNVAGTAGTRYLV